MRWMRLVLALAVQMPPLAGVAAAQQPPRAAVELSAGLLMFPDDGVVTEGMVGGSARFHLLPLVAMGPELVFVQGSNHNRLMLTGNVTFDFIGPAGGGARAHVADRLYISAEARIGWELHLRVNGAVGWRF
jgi:hypothetical protein